MNLVNDMVGSGRLKLSFWTSLSHYFIVIFLLLIPAFSTFSLIEYYFLESYDGMLTPHELINGYLMIIPAVVFFFVQKNRLKFKKYEITASEEEIEMALMKTVDELNWRIDEKSKGFIRVFRSWDFSVGFGEMITIIPTEKSILINSICDPNKVSVTSFGMNKTNIRTFAINLYNQVNGTSILKPEEKTNNWSLGNIIFRIFAYPFCIGLILFSIFQLFPNDEIGLGFSAILISAFYFYTDLT